MSGSFLPRESAPRGRQRSDKRAVAGGLSRLLREATGVDSAPARCLPAGQFSLERRLIHLHRKRHRFVVRREVTYWPVRARCTAGGASSFVTLPEAAREPANGSSEPPTGPSRREIAQIQGSAAHRYTRKG
jgi:hypothetical protein